MNKFKYFDRPQLLISIVGVSAFAISLIIYVIMFLTAQVIYSDEGVMENMIYNETLQNIYTLFLAIHLGAVTWFIARSITFKRRKKEADIF